MINNRIESIANNILSSLKIENASEIDLKKISKFLNIDVQKEDMHDEISGLFVIKDGNSYIRYNSHQDKNRQRFTIAHELGHSVLHKETPLFVDKKNERIMYRNSDSSTGEIRKEREANAFAAALLMPADFIKEEWQNIPLEESPVEYLAEVFQVSSQAMSFRLANLGYEVGMY